MAGAARVQIAIPDTVAVKGVAPSHVLEVIVP